jgi:hypothetical protein
MVAKGALSYFQEQLATVVIAGLIYVVCELYLDDVIVYGNTKEEFLERLVADIISTTDLKKCSSASASKILLSIQIK